MEAEALKNAAIVQPAQKEEAKEQQQAAERAKEQGQAAGSPITDDVPSDALSIARQRQTNKEDWVVKNNPYREKKY